MSFITDNLLLHRSTTYYPLHYLSLHAIIRSSPEIQPPRISEFSTGVLGFDPEKNNHKLNFLQAHMIIY